MSVTKLYLYLSLICLLLLPTGCSAVGMAAGAGAALGISVAKEGGMKSALSDLQIKALIADKWFKYDMDTFADLNVTVNQGRVLLTGAVSDPDDRVEAVRLAWQVEDIKQIINEVQVSEDEGLGGALSDKWITMRLRAALTFDRDVQSINYSIDTVQGVVYLMGVAQNQSELQHTIEVARTVPNVRQVISYVKMSGEPVKDSSRGQL